MKLEFEDITFEHFGILRTQTMPLSALGYGVHFIRGVNKFKSRLGSNGAGKSSIWHALSWCLFGYTSSGLRANDVKPWGTKSITSVWVTVCIDDKAHVIKRSTISNGLWVDDKVVAQETIDKMLGLTVTTFPHTIVLAQGQDLFFDLKPQGKMQILSECLLLDRWEERSTNAKVATIELNNERVGLSAKLASIESELLRTRHQVRDIKTQMEAWEKDQEQRVGRSEKELKALEKQLDAAELELGTFDLAYDRAETELRALGKDLAKRAKEFEGLLEVVATTEGACTQIVDRLDGLRQVAESGVCPTCGQAIKNKQTHAKHAADQIETEEKALRVANKRYQKATDDRNHHSVVTSRLRAAERKFLENSNDAVDGRTRAQGKVQKFKAEIASLKKQQTQETELENPYAAMLVKSRAVIKEIKEQFTEAGNKLAKVERKITHTKYWVDGFKNVRLYLLQEVLEELEAVTQTMLPQIGLDGWEVHYAIERETKSGTIATGLNVSITMDNQAPVNWKAWSGGEGQRLRLIGSIALSEVLLRRAGVECDMMVLDEPTKHLSLEGVNETVQFLIERGNDSQIFYVDHTARESTRFASTIEVVRDKRGAQIRVEQTREHRSL